jgi:hypothetical protein
LAEFHDFLMAASDEVPPHDDVLGERLSAEHDHLTSVRTSEMEAAPAISQEEQLINSDRRRFGYHRSGNREDAVFEGLVQGKHDIRPGLESQLRAAER